MVHSAADGHGADGAHRQIVIRALRPTDLGPFLTFRSRTPSNAALLGPMARTGGLTFREFLGRSLAINPGRETWVQIEHGQVFGLVAARARFGTDVWDIDHLMIAPSVDGDRVCLRLLDHLCAAAVEEGVQKVFLRLPIDSPWLHPARQAGFVHYTSEQIFVVPHLQAVPRPTVAGLRPRRPADHQALFQLYTGIVPAPVRQIEALTLQEWRWTDNWGLTYPAPIRPALPRRRRDLVLQTDDHLSAWLPIHLRARSLQILLDHRAEVEPDVLVARGLSELTPNGPVAFPLRDYQGHLVEPLVERGFVQGDSHALLARMLTARVPERRLIPAGVA